MSRLDEIKERWYYFLGDTWSHADRRDRVTGAGVVAFAPCMQNILLVVKRDVDTAIIVAAVSETAPLVRDAIVKAPEDIAYLLEYIEHGGGRL